MKRGARQLAAGVVVLLAALGAAARPVPPEVQNTLPDATLGVTSRFTYFGFQIYDASLWVAPGFRLADYHRHAFALELTYLRDFTGDAIAKRSVVEMRRQSGVTEEQLELWQKLMQEAFPDVRQGDRLTGIHRPGQGAKFLLNGQPARAIPDDAFARHFFGIWLSSQSSDTRLRDAVTAQPATR